MSEYQILTVFAAFAFVYSLVASRLEKTPVNGALVYVVVGMLCGPHLLGLVDLEVDTEGISRLAEIALAICLFSDSSNANLAVLRRIESIPVRLLMVGLPLTIAFGVLLAWLIFPELSFYEVALIGAMLAPTDAALGKAVVTNPAVPAKVRESLNVESGLNDGICVPVILFFIALTAGTIEASESGSAIVRLGFEVIGIGLATGLVLALFGGFALRTCAARGWVAGTWLQFPIIALALLCFGLAQWLGGSGFIASFVGGLTFGALTKQHKEEFLLAAEGTADADRSGDLVYFWDDHSAHSGAGAQLASALVRNPEPIRDSHVACVLVPDRQGIQTRHAAIHGLVRTARLGQYRVRRDGHRCQVAGQRYDCGRRFLDDHTERAFARAFCQPTGVTVWCSRRCARRRDLKTSLVWFELLGSLGKRTRGHRDVQTSKQDPRHSNRDADHASPRGDRIDVTIADCQTGNEGEVDRITQRNSFEE